MWISQLIYSYEVTFDQQHFPMSHGYVWTPNAPHQLTHLYLAHRHGKLFRRWSKIRATSLKCVLYELTIPYRPKCRFFYSACKMAFFSLIMSKIKQHHQFRCFFGKRSNIFSLFMYSTRIAFVRSNLANLLEIFFKSVLNFSTKHVVRKWPICKTWPI